VILETIVFVVFALLAFLLFSLGAKLVTDAFAIIFGALIRFFPSIYAYGLFAVDSIASIYHSQLLNTQTALLASVARMLQGKLSTEIGHLLDTADVYEVPAIIVSWSRSPAADSFQKRKRVEALKAIQSGDPEFDLEAGLGAWEYPIVGGRHLIYYSKVLLHLRTLEITSGEKLAVLEKSIEQPSNRCVRFQIGQKGIGGTEKEKVQPLQEYLYKIAEEKVDE